MSGTRAYRGYCGSGGCSNFRYYYGGPFSSPGTTGGTRGRGDIFDDDDDDGLPVLPHASRLLSPPSLLPIRRGRLKGSKNAIRPLTSFAAPSTSEPPSASAPPELTRTGPQVKEKVWEQAKGHSQPQRRPRGPTLEDSLEELQVPVPKKARSKNTIIPGEDPEE